MWCLGPCGVVIWLGNTGYATAHIFPQFRVPNALQGSCGRRRLRNWCRRCLLGFPNLHQKREGNCGWLIMNLSSVVPAAVSIWVYKEKLTPLKIVAFALGLASVLCSFWAQKTEAPETVKLGGEKD